MHPALSTLPAWSLPFMGSGGPGRGIIHGLPEADYHGTKALISKSALDVFGGKSPFHYLASLDAELEDRFLPQFRIGGAYHVAVLEPDLYRQKVVTMPNFGPMQSSTNRATRDAWFKHELNGRIWLTPIENHQIIAMRDVMLASREGKKLLTIGGQPEVTALWTCPETGLRCKSRGDWVHADHGIFVDLKSALSAAPWSFKRASGEHRYHVQDAMYSRAFEENDIHIEHFVFLAQEKEYPYAVAAYQLNDSARLRGEDLYMRELRALRQCIDDDYFPSYSPTGEVMALDLPPWVLNDHQVGA
ncbi:MAG: PD-(D/E)XK nuclease-like domain-containing protein [Pseudomonadota bacterium]